jgi:hypothetical protein
MTRWELGVDVGKCSRYLTNRMSYALGLGSEVTFVMLPFWKTATFWGVKQSIGMPRIDGINC